jgi:hypothetical protein
LIINSEWARVREPNTSRKNRKKKKKKKGNKKFHVNESRELVRNVSVVNHKALVRKLLGLCSVEYTVKWERNGFTALWPPVYYPIGTRAFFGTDSHVIKRSFFLLLLLRCMRGKDDHHWSIDKHLEVALAYCNVYQYSP